MSGEALLGAPVAPAPPIGTARSSVFTLINSAVGAGVLSFPFAFRQLGWAAGLAAVAAIASIEGFSLYALCRYAEHTKTTTYSSMVRKMLGRGASLLMCVVMLAYPFGSCVAYLIILGDSFRPLLLELFGPTWFTGRAAIICGVGCACILPLCFRTRLGALKAVSSMSVWGLLVVAAIVVLRAAQIVGAPGYSWAPVRAFNPSGLQFLSALVIIIFGFQCHTNVVSVFDELEPRPLFFPPSPDPSVAGGAADGAGSGAAAAARYESLPPLDSGGLRRKTDKLAGMIRVVAAMLLTTALLYSTVGLAGYLAFPDSAASDIMVNFGAEDPLVARATVGLIMIAAYVVNHFPARGAIRDLLEQATGRAFGGPGFLALETPAFFGSTLALALVVTDLGSIFELVGGTCGNVLIFLMPGALLVEYAASKARTSRQRRQLAAELEGPLAGAEVGAGAPGAPPPYRLWTSKLFWAGVLLLAISAGLFVLTFVTTFSPPAAATS